MSDRFQVVSTEDLSTFLAENSEWKFIDGKLEREFSFPDFIQAFSFLTKVAIASEKLNHHPEIYNIYNTVKIFGLCTHDADNQITTLDLALASEISQLYK